MGCGPAGAARQRARAATCLSAAAVMRASRPGTALFQTSFSPAVSKRRKSARFAVARRAPSWIAAAAIRQAESERRRRPESLKRRAAIPACSKVRSRWPSTTCRASSVSAGSIGPHKNSAHAMVLTTTGSSGCGLQKSSLRRSLVQHADQETCVQVDHRDSLESRRKDALRISFAWCSQPARSTPRAATDFWSARRACNLASAGDDCRSASLRIALRSASDFETFQRRANPSSVRTVPTSREYVDLIVMTAMPFTVWPYQAVRRIVAILRPPSPDCRPTRFESPPAALRCLSTEPRSLVLDPGRAHGPLFAMMPPDPARDDWDVMCPAGLAACGGTRVSAEAGEAQFSRWGSG